jgi:hypothetical protein
VLDWTEIFEYFDCRGIQDPLGKVLSLRVPTRVARKSSFNSEKPSEVTVGEVEYH